MIVNEFAENGLGPVDTDTFDAFSSNCPAFGPWRLRFLHVGAFDVDGDGIDEIHANLRVYEDLSAVPELSLIHELPQEVFVDGGSDAGARISRVTPPATAGRTSWSTPSGKKTASASGACRRSRPSGSPS